MMSGTYGTVADDTLTVYNPYDGKVYAFSKSPSSMTVDITNDVVAYGSSVMIKGAITDISAGTQQNEQAARFPHGVPCISYISQKRMDGIRLHAKTTPNKRYRCTHRH
jgi:hypothetical protein